MNPWRELIERGFEIESIKYRGRSFWCTDTFDEILDKDYWIIMQLEPALKRFGDALQEFYDALEAEAAKHNMTVEEYLAALRVIAHKQERAKRLREEVLFQQSLLEIRRRRHERTEASGRN